MFLICQSSPCLKATRVQKRKPLCLGFPFLFQVYFPNSPIQRLKCSQRAYLLITSQPNQRVDDVVRRGFSRVSKHFFFCSRFTCFFQEIHKVKGSRWNGGISREFPISRDTQLPLAVKRCAFSLEFALKPKSMVLGLFKKRYHPSASSELTSEYYSLELWPFLIIQCFLISLSFKSTPTGSGFQPKNAGVLYYYALSTTALFTKRVTTFVVFISSSPPSSSSGLLASSTSKNPAENLTSLAVVCLHATGLETTHHHHRNISTIH